MREERCGWRAVSYIRRWTSISRVCKKDGRSASLTAPNGQAQRGLLVAALADARATADALVLTEAHGTGTALGDPTEAGALAAVHGGRTCGAVVVGAVVGACEAEVAEATSMSAVQSSTGRSRMMHKAPRAVVALRCTCTVNP